MTVNAYPLLQKHVNNFIGNIESRELFDNKADIVLCDGFTGNIVLNAGTYGIHLTDTGDNTVVTGNIVKDSAGVALFVNDAALDCVVVGNRFDGSITFDDGISTVESNNIDSF